VIALPYHALTDSDLLTLEQVWMTKEISRLVKGDEGGIGKRFIGSRDNCKPGR